MSILKVRIKLEKYIKKIFYICPKTGKIVGQKNNKKWVLGLFPIIGFLCLIWFLIRVIPKPSRATYPCQRLAAPLALGFIKWLVGLVGSSISYFKAKQSFKCSKFIVAGICAIIVVLAVFIPLNFTSNNIVLGYTLFKEPNSPIGVAIGINPGRVTWVLDTRATKFNGTGFWWDDNNTDQNVVNEMISKSICWLAGKPTDKEAWDAIFKYFNHTKNGNNCGYQKGEKIVIKVNLNQDRNTKWSNHHMPSPHTVYALVDQLISVVGAKGEDITIVDASRTIGDPLYNKIHKDPNPEFQAVKFVGGNRTLPIGDISHPIYFSGNNIPVAGVPTVYTEAKYIINMALLRAHTIFGVTLCGKNHFGSIYFEELGFNPEPLHQSQWSTYGKYHCIVDLIGHDELGGKTVLYMIDGLYHALNQEDKIHKFASFDNGWASSIFASQDPVAIDSVVLDFLANESNISVKGSSGCPDNYLIEAALANNPPSGTFYNPNNTGGLNSLGVHEHWNNPSDKKYSRNLGTGNGIELCSQEPINMVTEQESFITSNEGKIFMPWSEYTEENIEELIGEEPRGEEVTGGESSGKGESSEEECGEEKEIEEEVQSKVIEVLKEIVKEIVKNITQFFINLWD
jgi:hypothetical protein